MELPRQRPNLPALTSLRFFAAFVVVAFHYNPDRLVNLPDFFRSWLETGYEAVTFFFVLSGFIMSYMYSDYGETTPRKLGGRSFYVARFARLAPAYYFALVVALPFIVLDAFVWDEESTGRFVLEGTLFGTFLQSWWPPAALAWNPPGWSVSVEWCLYAVFPMLAAWSRRWSGMTMLIVTFLLLTAVAALRLWGLRPLIDEESDDLYNFMQYFPLFHVPTFFFGMALGRLQVTGPRPGVRLASAMCLISLVALMLKFSGSFDFAPIFKTDTVHAALFGILIVGAAQPGHICWRLLGFAPAIYLGEISYSMYVMHEPIMMWWEALWPKIGGEQAPAWVQFPLFFAIVIAASAACFHWVEAPMRRRLRRWLDR